MNIIKFSEKPKIVLIQGSPRVEDNCPNFESKTSKIVDYIVKKYKGILDIEVIDLAIKQKTPIIQPCKACVSTGGGYHCHWPCIPSSERVQTKFGYEYINKIKDDEELSTGKVIKQWMTSELEDIYEIILSDGRKLRLTNNHKIKILSSERFRNKETDWNFFRNEEWKELKDIKIGDFVPEIKLGGEFNSKTKFSSEYFLLSGLFWGDGTIAGKDSLLIYYDDKSEHNFGEKIKKELNFYVSDREHNSNSIIREGSVNNSEMRKINYGAEIGRKIQYEMGFEKIHPAKDRRLPKILFDCSEEELCLFFNGWFSTDGSVSKKNISLCNISYDCLRDAQLLLAKLGIKSSVSNNNHLTSIVRGKDRMRASTLSIYGYDNIKIFKNKIGFISEYKENKLDSILSIKKDKMKNKPAFVKSIKLVGKESVYDITVENTHEFISEGILVHNCDCYFKGDKSRHKDFMYEHDVYEKLQNCDAFVVFSPIHWYSVTSQVKAMFDRLICANLTITHEEAIEMFGDNLKTSKITGVMLQNSKAKLKNHLEGKYAAFYIHGDNGSTDYKNQDLPESFNENDEYDIKYVIKPLVNQCKYSGIFVPDDLVETFYMNENKDYYTANFTSLDFANTIAENLIERLIKYLNTK